MATGRVITGILSDEEDNSARRHSKNGRDLREVYREYPDDNTRFSSICLLVRLPSPECNIPTPPSPVPARSSYTSDAFPPWFTCGGQTSAPTSPGYYFRHFP
ncbi:hypothetical protein BKA83DRAFT_4125430 [Pisolithus microcarpus]|nr:hypothetical protein BKA83DRAFT_4125430 [Pisolithus microcarpus]